MNPPFKVSDRKLLHLPDDAEDLGLIGLGLTEPLPPLLVDAAAAADEFGAKLEVVVVVEAAAGGADLREEAEGAELPII